MNLTSSTEFSINGEHSLKSTSNTTGYCAVKLYSGTSIQNEQYTGEISILNKSGNNVYLRLNETDNNLYNDITILSQDNPQTITISRTITNDSTLEFILILRTPTTVYIDNIILTKT